MSKYFGMVPGTQYELKTCQFSFFIGEYALCENQNKQLKLYSECFKVVGNCDPPNAKQRVTDKFCI